MNLIPLGDRGQRTATGDFLMSRWRAQRIVYTRAMTNLSTYRNVSYKLDRLFLTVEWGY